MSAPALIQVMEPQLSIGPEAIRELDSLRTIARLAIAARRAQGFYFRARGRMAPDTRELLNKARKCELELDNALVKWLELYGGEKK